MSVVLPQSVNYADSLPSLPDNTQQIPVVASPVNGQTFTSGSQIQFDLLNRGFLVPDSMYLRYTTTVTNTGAFQVYQIGCPAYNPFNRLDVQVGSQTVDTIQSYNVLMNMLTNVTLDVAQKYGLQSGFGYLNNTTVPSLEQLDARDLGAVATTQSYSLGAPLMSILSNSDKLIPLFAMPQIRIVLTMDSIASCFNIASGGAVTAFTLSNLELCYKVIDMGGNVEDMVRSMGDKIYIKSQSFSCASQTLGSGSSGYNELVFNQRYASVKGLFAINGGTTIGANKAFDSTDVTTGNGEYSFSIGGVIYPQKPISSLINRAGALMELKSATGSIFDKSNAFAINSVEFSANSATATTAQAMGKFFIGTSTEKLNSDSLLTGISTQNSPISYRISTGTATGQAHLITLVVNYDALWEVDTVNRQVAVKC
jgi:hypothetical protein